MTGLYPIIRRVRRPLIVQDAPPVNAGSVEPVNLNAEREARSAEAKSVNEVSGGTPETTRETRVLPTETSDAKTTTIEEPGPAVGE